MDEYNSVNLYMDAFSFASASLLMSLLRIYSKYAMHKAIYFYTALHTCTKLKLRIVIFIKKLFVCLFKTVADAIAR